MLELAEIFFTQSESQAYTGYQPPNLAIGTLHINSIL
jgi:hypothetical protein